MVYARAGVVVVAFGLLMLAAPQLVIRFQQWSYPNEDLEASAWRIRIVRYAGLAFLAIGAAFLVVGTQGWL